MRAARELLAGYQHVISELRLITGSHGVFDVRIDGELVFSKYEAGRHAKPGELAGIFGERVGSDAVAPGEE